MSRLLLQHRLSATRALAAVVTCAFFLNSVGTVQAATTLFVNTESFETIDQGDGTSNVELRFGPNSETIQWNIVKNTFTISDDVEVQGILSGVTLYATQSFSGAGLSDCDNGTTSKLLWDATTGRFSCGTDQTGGGSLTAGQGLSLNGTVLRMSDSISGSLLEFQTISGAYIHAEEKLTSSGTLSVERQALFTGGTLSVPGIAFADAPNTGLRQVTVGSDTQLQFINDGIATMSVSNFADQQYYPRVAIGKNISDYTALDVYTQISGYAASFVNDFNGFGNAHGLYVSTLQDDGDYLARFVSNSTDKFTVLTSGNVGVGTDAPKAKLAVVGTISGTTLYATQSFSGAGLTDCDTGATSKLLWDATTGRFSCGTDQGGGSGMNQADADLRFLKLSGGTLTGALTIQNGNTHIPTLSTMLNVRGTISGAMLRAGNMTVSGAVVYSSGNTLMQTAKGLSGQLLIAQGTNAPKWATPVGGMMWYFDGTQAVATSKGPQITMPFGLIVESISLSAKGAPTGAALIMDINKDGVSIFSTRPQIDADAVTGGGAAVFSTTVIPVNSVLTLDVDQIGSTFAGSGITVMLKGTRQY